MADRYAYVRVDDAAKDGTGRCLRAEDGSLHSGSWDEERGLFVYSSGAPIMRTITHYCARLPMLGSEILQ